MAENTTLGQDARHGSFGKGVMSSFFSFISIIVFPLFILYFMGNLLENMGMGSEMAPTIEALGETVERYMIYGIPVIVIAFFTSFYAKGNKAKMIASLVALAYSLVWMMLIFGTGVIPVSIDTSGFGSGGDLSVDSVTIAMSMTGIFYILAFLILMKMILVPISYKSNREKYLKSLDKE